ncbi:nuclease (SNase domain-containing protein) [Oleidesulfovibrio alaskensis G20]|uniref:Nuclease (SNase domain-containing protein) n=1 Tax=Oleidesulfovibrio alaskensis (strain ATCC BAA-1058 / DSM 17464 / G20) TaxID=207559 RepID=Q30XJ4_OLEA2|nr:thermonuclease family protein [Oleidesulfovibrio alaskensis]ABB39602.1 nuclease (SNase domain-containing protein) [Oleidesulfovibrio alaskensis G20]
MNKVTTMPITKHKALPLIAYLLFFFLSCSLISPSLIVTAQAREDDDGATPTPSYTSTNVVIVSRVTSVYDGDTFRCDIDGWPAIIGKNIGIRINGIDTPEMRDKRPQVKALAIEARDFVRSRLKEANVIELRNIQRGKYFRIVADVYLDGSVNLAEELIQRGLACEYHGGKKVFDWEK